MRNTLIFCNGSITNYKKIKTFIKPDSHLIAVDGGIRHVRKLNMTPHTIIGDMDSISPEDEEYFKKKSLSFLNQVQDRLLRTRGSSNTPIQWLTYPTDKDQTDSELAINYAIKRLEDYSSIRRQPERSSLPIQSGSNSIKPPHEILIFGTHGNRIDHFLALLFHTSHIQNVSKKIITDDAVLQVIYKKITLLSKNGDIFSLIPLRSVTGLTIKGAKYELKNATLKFGATQGVSNEFLNNEVKISYSRGLLLLIQAN